MDSAANSSVNSSLLLAIGGQSQSVSGFTTLAPGRSSEQVASGPGLSFAQIMQSQQQAVTPSGAHVLLPGQFVLQGQQSSLKGPMLTNMVGKALPVGGDALPVQGLAMQSMASSLVLAKSVTQTEADPAELLPVESLEGESISIFTGPVFTGPMLPITETPVAQTKLKNLTPTSVTVSSQQLASVAAAAEKPVNPVPGITIQGGEQTIEMSLSAVSEKQAGVALQQLPVNPNLNNATDTKQSVSLEQIQHSAKPLLASEFVVKPTIEASLQNAFTTDEPVELALQRSESALKGLEHAINQASTVAVPRLETLAGYRDASFGVWQTDVPVTVGKSGWGEAVMQRVMWMSSQQVQTAEIALDPPELGPLQVRISNQADQTSVMFSSQHGLVRDALDQSLPRLREMLEGQGIDLADVDVSEHGLQRQDAGQEETEAQGSFARDDSGMSEGQDVEQSLATVSVGLIDERV